MSKYVFNHLADMVGYCYHQLINPTPIRLQKVLYFSWAYYVGTIEQNPNWPKYLFPSEFVALTYGPVNLKVYQWTKDHQLETLTNQIPNRTSFQQNSKSLLDSIISQANDLYDFKLAMISMQDMAWQQAAKQQTVMNPLQIQSDYQNK